MGIEDYIDKKTFFSNALAQVIAVFIVCLIYLSIYALYICIEKRNLSVETKKIESTGQKQIFLAEETEKELQGLIDELKTDRSEDCNYTDQIWEFNGIGGVGKTAYVYQLANKHKDSIEVWKVKVSDIFDQGLSPLSRSPMKKRMEVLLKKANKHAIKTGKKVIIFLDELQRYLKDGNKGEFVSTNSILEVEKFIHEYFGNGCLIHPNIQFICCTNTPIENVMNVNTMNSIAFTRKVKQIKFKKMDGYAFLNWFYTKINNCDYYIINDSAKSNAEDFVKEIYDQLIQNVIKRKSWRLKFDENIPFTEAQFKEGLEISTQHFVAFLDRCYENFIKDENELNKDLSEFKIYVIKLIDQNKINISAIDNQVMVFYEALIRETRESTSTQIQLQIENNVLLQQLIDLQLEKNANAIS